MIIDEIDGETEAIVLSFEGTSIVDVLSMPEQERKVWYERAIRYQERVRDAVKKARSAGRGRSYRR